MVAVQAGEEHSREPEVVRVAEQQELEVAIPVLVGQEE